MSVIVIIGLGLLGLILGSFVNAFVWRIHTKQNWISDRSRCSHCNHVLGPKDLIPVVSWLLLKGKCRYCGAKIEDSPLVELSLAILFILSYVFWPLAMSGVGIYLFIFWILFLTGFMALAVYDLRWFLLPDGIVYTLVFLALAQILGEVIFYHYDWREILQPLAAAIVLSGIFYVIFQVSKGEWIGGGDVKLALVLGLLAGDPLRSMLLLFFASLLGMAVSMPKLLKQKSIALKMKIPFGPFLIGALIIVYIFGTPLVNWYINLFAAYQ